MLLAFPPGGPTDINARIFALKLGEAMNQQIIVDNKPGAGGNIAAAEAAKAPAATPKEIVARLNAEINKAVQNADLRLRLATQGAEPLGGTSEHYAAYIRSELVRWSKVAKDSGARID